MKKFFGADLFLGGKSAKAIYKAVKDLPIIDYHCHLDQTKIKNDANFFSLNIKNVALDGQPAKKVLYGSIMDILNRSSELIILANSLIFLAGITIFIFSR